MPTDRRRAAARRRAWGRGPIILRFEPLEGRQLLAASTTPLPDLAGGAFDTLHNLDWGDTFHAAGQVVNEGNAATTAPFQVDFFASPTSGVGPNSVLLGQATIPAGVQPGQAVPFDQVVSLPATPLTGVDPSGSIYVNMVIDPQGAVTESNKANNEGTGQGYDTSLVTITPHKPASLVGASLGVYPDQAQWGQPIQITQQIQNAGTGDAPATRAQVVLTPSGQAPGGPADFTIASIPVPAIAAGQTATVSPTVNLPNVPPSVLAGSTQFTLSVIQDADFVTSTFSPHLATQGLGNDQTPLVITSPTAQTPTAGALPDLVASAVQAPTLPVTPGQNFQVTAAIQNQGKVDAGAFRVRFLLVGTDGSLAQALFLGDIQVQGLKAGFGQNIVQTLQIPTHIPAGLTLPSGTQAAVAVVIDPEYSVDESNKGNNVGYSGIVTVVAPGTVVTTTAPTTTTTASTTTATGTTTTTTTTKTVTKATAKAPAKKPAAVAPRKAAAPKKSVSATIKHDLKVFPSRVTHFVKDVFKAKKK